MGGRAKAPTVLPQLRPGSALSTGRDVHGITRQVKTVTLTSDSTQWEFPSRSNSLGHPRHSSDSVSLHLQTSTFNNHLREGCSVSPLAASTEHRDRDVDDRRNYDEENELSGSRRTCGDGLALLCSVWLFKQPQ